MTRVVHNSQGGASPNDRMAFSLIRRGAAFATWVPRCMRMQIGTIYFLIGGGMDPVRNYSAPEVSTGVGKVVVYSVTYEKGTGPNKPDRAS